MKTLVLKEIEKNYETKEKSIQVLKGVSYTFEKGKIYSIIGHSGSGKSTLLNIMGTLLSYDKGELWIDGKEIKEMAENEKAQFRNRKIGFVFQSYLLNGQLTALENVMVPMYINKEIETKDRKTIATELLKKVKMEKRLTHYPKALSGGEQQRVAIARALANNPDIILADEPTGNLDKKNEEMILEIFKTLKKEGKCIIIVSHSDNIKKYADVTLELDDGELEVV